MPFIEKEMIIEETWRFLYLWPQSSQLFALWRTSFYLWHLLGTSDEVCSPSSLGWFCYPFPMVALTTAVTMASSHYNALVSSLSQQADGWSVLVKYQRSSPACQLACNSFYDQRSCLLYWSRRNLGNVISGIFKRKNEIDNCVWHFTFLLFRQKITKVKVHKHLHI